MNFSDPYLLATKKHVADLFALYGKEIFMLNLVKLNEHIPREQILADEFNQAITNVKEELEEGDIGYLQFDMKATLK